MPLYTAHLYTINELDKLARLNLQLSTHRILCQHPQRLEHVDKCSLERGVWGEGEIGGDWRGGGGGSLLLRHTDSTLVLFSLTHSYTHSTCSTRGGGSRPRYWWLTTTTHVLIKRRRKPPPILVAQRAEVVSDVHAVVVEESGDARHVADRVGVVSRQHSSEEDEDLPGRVIQHSCTGRARITRLHHCLWP